MGEVDLERFRPGPNGGYQPRCQATAKSTGRQCGGTALRDQNFCKTHIRRYDAPAIRMRSFAASMGLTDDTIDPQVLMLRALAQTARRVHMVSLEVAEMAEASDGLAGLLTTYTDEHGHERVGGMHPLVEWEHKERQLLARTAELAVRAKLGDRSIELAERYVDVVERAMSQVFARLGLTEDQRAEATVILGEVLTEVTA